MASVDDFLRALDSIEAEIRAVPDVVFVEMSLTRGRITRVSGDTIDRIGRYIMLLTSRSIHAHWESLCFDIGGSDFPFVWSPKRSAVYESFPKELVNEPESVEFALWYYLDSWRSAVPQHCWIGFRRMRMALILKKSLRLWSIKPKWTEYSTSCDL